MEISKNIFPRNLTEIEKQLLFAVLPSNKIGYNSYREKINNLMVISFGRFGGTNFILGCKGDIPDFSISSSPIFAIGTVTTNFGKIDVLIHEEDDGMIEVDISGVNENDFTNELIIKRCDTFSNWIPGDKSPYDNLSVKEVLIEENKYVLAISLSQKKIWLHDFKTGVNHLIPLTNYYNELMRFKNIREPEIALRPKLFFESVNKYADIDLKMALYKYDNYLHKFKLPGIKTKVGQPKTKRSFLKIFNRGNN